MTDTTTEEALRKHLRRFVAKDDCVKRWQDGFSYDGKRPPFIIPQDDFWVIVKEALAPSEPTKVSREFVFNLLLELYGQVDGYKLNKAMEMFREKGIVVEEREANKMKLKKAMWIVLTPKGEPFAGFLEHTEELAIHRISEALHCRRDLEEYKEYGYRVIPVNLSKEE